MKCNNCGIINDEDAVFCKNCGESLTGNKKVEKKANNKVKKKTKTKKKVKVKKIKQKKKVKNNNQNNMSFGQKLLMFFMTLLIIILLGGCIVGGYYYYQKQNIVVPNVVGLSYEEAQQKLTNAGLIIQKKEKVVTDDTDENIVISQSKRANSKTSEKSKVKVTVGVLKEYKLPNFVGKDIDKVTEILDRNNISYKISYQTVSDDDNKVLYQSPNKNQVIKINEVVYLTVSKVNDKEKEKIIEEESLDEEATENDDTE